MKRPDYESSCDCGCDAGIARRDFLTAAGCTTNVEIELTDRPDACMVQGHHNLIFCGDLARKFRLFANLMKIDLAETG